MAEPFSVVTGALSVVDVCTRVGKYLRNIQKTARHVTDKIANLDREIKTFEKTYVVLASMTPTADPGAPLLPRAPGGVKDPSNELWDRAGTLVQDGLLVVKKLEAVLERIVGDGSSSKLHILEDVRKAIRMSSQSTEYDRLRASFTVLNLELGMVLTAIDLTSNHFFRSAAFTSLEQLSREQSQGLQSLGLQLKHQISELEKSVSEAVPSVAAAKNAVRFATLNEHFYLPKAEDPMWTGRRQDLSRLRNAILNPDLDDDRRQKRFVIHGITGAGKTHLSCKFAQDYRESFWGIFWVDASSEQTARESWKRIARIGGKDPNEEAGKYWLSNLHSPWLLIVDGADTSEQSIRAQFPSGERGCILITTRNPRMTFNATIGSLTLNRLEEHEANELLRKSTAHTPWDGPAIISASSIAKQLYYYPLALVHAGSAIRHGVTTLYGYIKYFNKALDGLRSKRDSSLTVDDDDDDDDGLGAFTTFDILYSGLEALTTRKPAKATVSRDAIELINTFAFLHYNEIDLKMFIKAGQNFQQSATAPSIEEEARPSTTWQAISQRLESLAEAAHRKFIQPAPVLPQLLRTPTDSAFSELRARKALDLLVSTSLLSLSENSVDTSYSMHPLVHVWVRKRHGLMTQALWCGVAGDILATSIKVPPMADETGDQDLYTRMLPHVDHFRAQKHEIDLQLSRNRERASYLRFWTRMTRAPSLTTSDALKSARYSRVYLECGKFTEAEQLLRLAREFVIRRLGKGSRRNVQISLVLSKLLERLGRSAEAQELQEDALQISKSRLGARHSLTLKTMDALGETFQHRVWLKRAKELHQAAIDGMEGRADLKRDRLKAILNLAHVYQWHLDYEKALELQQMVYNELKEDDPDDLDTLNAKDNMAMTLFELGGIAQVKQARNLMEDVHAKRMEKLGEQHLYTLWAACNLARTLTLLGSLEKQNNLIEEAIVLFDDGIATVKRNTSEDHFGTLMGRGCRANALVALGKYEEAEMEYKDVANRQLALPGSRSGTNLHRLATLEKLADCLELQRKFGETLQVCHTSIEEIDALGGHSHPLRDVMMRKHTAVEAMMTTPDMNSASP